MKDAKYTDWSFGYKIKNRDIDKTHIYWKHCESVIVLSSMGVGALNSHAKGKIIQHLLKKYQCFFKTLNCKTSAGYQGKNQVVIILWINQQITHSKQQISLFSPTTSKNHKKQSLELHVEKKDVVEAEFMSVLHAVISGLSGNGSDKIGNLFQVMFPDSQIAKDFHINHKKIWHVSYELAHYFKGMLEERIIELNSLFFVSYYVVSKL